MSNLKEWLPVLGLALASFIFVSSEFSPVGLLPQIAETLNESEAKTGLIMTAYAWCVAIVSLPMMLLTAKIERRFLITALLFVFSVGNLLVGLSSEFYTIMGARLLIAFVHALFWAISVPLATRVAPYGKYSYGLSTVSAGVTLAIVLGMPLGKYIGDQYGWHSTFFTISGTAFLIMVVIRIILPKLPSSNAGNLKSIPELFRNKAIVAAYFTVLFMVTGHFTLYTYIVPFLSNISNFDENISTILLFVYGLSGIVGILISNKFMDKSMRELLIISTIFVIVPILLIFLVSKSLVGVTAVLVVWSVASTLFGINMNLWVLKLAPKSTDAAMALYSGIFNIGIGSGALFGGITIDTLGLSNIGYIGALFIMPTVFLVYLFAQNFKKTS